jgi:meso-butanediol dehydrogenase / (S,S)-butanediol dehydrogenase / diacetyl reductase
MAKKRAIVTGASSGIGREAVRLLAQDGWQVMAVARRGDRLSELAKELPDKVIAHAADITADGVPEKVIAAAAAKMGGLDLLVNNAGTSWVAAFADIPTDRLDAILNLNVRALMLMCRAAISELEKTRGQIINVSSVADRLPMETLAVYCASKAAATMFNKALAKELGSKKIRVNLLSPCGTDTEIFSKANGSQPDAKYLIPARDMAQLVVLLTKLPETLDLGELAPHQRYSPW